MVDIGVRIRFSGRTARLVESTAQEDIADLLQDLRSILSVISFPHPKAQHVYKDGRAGDTLELFWLDRAERFLDNLEYKIQSLTARELSRHEIFSIALYHLQESKARIPDTLLPIITCPRSAPSSPRHASSRSTSRSLSPRPDRSIFRPVAQSTTPLAQRLLVSPSTPQAGGHPSTPPHVRLSQTLSMNSSTPLEARLNAARPPPSSPAAMRAGPGTPRRVPSAGTVPTASSSFSSAAHSTQTITPSTEKTTPSTISSLTPSVLRPPPAQPSALSRVPSAESMSISSKSTTPTPLPPSSSASLTPRKPPLVAPVDAASVSGSPALAVPAHPTFQGPPRQPAPTPSTPSPTPAILSTISTSPRPRNATAKPMSTPTPAQPPPAISIPSSSSGVIDLTLPVATLGPAFQPLPRPPSRQSSASQPSSPAPSSRSAQVYDDARAAQRNQALVQFGQKMKERAVAAEEREKALQAELAELKSLLVENEAKAHRQLAELETRARSQSLEQEENMKRQLAEYEVKAKNRLSEQEEKMKSLAEANDRLQAMQIMLTNKLKTAEAAATTRLLKLQGKAEMALTDGTEAIALSDAISSLEKHVEGLQTALRTESLGQQSASRRLKEEQEKLAKVTRELEEARGKTSTIKEMHKTVTPSTDTIDKQGLELERLCRTLEAERATRLSVEERLRTELEAHGRSVAPTGKESGDAQVEQELLALLSKELEDARQEINVALQGRLMSARHEELQPPRKPAKLEEGEGRIPERQSRTVEDLENERRLVQDMLGMLRDEIFARQRLEMQLQEEKIKRAEDVAILHSQRRDLESARNKLEELLHEEERRLGHVLADLEEERRNGLELRELLEREAAGRRAIKDELSDARESHERAMRAIERECREPFVVPALLDAFLTISAMSDRVLSA